VNHIPAWITAITGLIVSIGGTWVTFKTIIPTHKIVNQEKTDRDNFNRALIRALDEAGIKVPVDQSIKDKE
jgi:hypothetical protein